MVYLRCMLDRSRYYIIPSAIVVLVWFITQLRVSSHRDRTWKTAAVKENEPDRDGLVLADHHRQTWPNGTIHPANNKTAVCRWVKYRAQGHEIDMCVHNFPDIVSNAIAKRGSWSDCSLLTLLWKETDQAAASGHDTYVDVGGNIGSCVFHMLLTTAVPDIRVFEPNPDNLFCLTSTLAFLPDDMQSRVTVYNMGLGDTDESQTLHVARGNMGNGAIGKLIKDFSSQKELPVAAPVKIKRYDSVIEASANVRLVKMDAQGYECNIIRGFGNRTIGKLKTELTEKFLDNFEGCSKVQLVDLLKCACKK